MPDILMVDLAAVLDTSKVGAEAARALEKQWTAAKSQPEEKQRALLAELSKQRDSLRAALLARAKPAVAQLAKKKGAKVVLERGAVVWAEASVEDVTAAVIAAVDGKGPLALK